MGSEKNIYTAMSDELIAKATKDLDKLELQLKPMLKKELSKRAKSRKQKNGKKSQ